MGQHKFIKKLVADGKLREAILTFSQIVERRCDTEECNSAAVLSMSLEDLNREWMRGTISFGKLTRGKAKIATRLLEMIDHLDNQQDALADELADIE